MNEITTFEGLYFVNTRNLGLPSAAQYCSDADLNKNGVDHADQHRIERQGDWGDRLRAHACEHPREAERKTFF